MGAFSFQFPFRLSVRHCVIAGLLAAALFAAGDRGAFAQSRDAGGVGGGQEMINLDFNDVELNVVVDTISRMTGYNFIYDDRVRGRVTIVSPSRSSNRS